jgi:predicted dehydrogenase
MGRNHIRLLAELPGVELVAVAEESRRVREAALRGRSVRGYATCCDLFSEESVDVAVVAVPTRAHEEVACIAIGAGCHVLVEKPVADSITAAQRMQDAAAAAGLIISVGLVERFNPAVIELGRRIASGELGQVFQVMARRTGPFPPRVRDVGVVRDLATHDLDIVRFTIGSPFEFIFAQVARHVHTEHEDLVTAIGRLDNGVIAVFDVNWLTPTKVRELTVLAEGGMFLVDYLRQDLTKFRNGDVKADLGPLSALRGVSEGDMVRFAIDRVEPLRAELAAFVEAVRSGGAPPVPVGEAIESLALVDATLKSADLGLPVVPESEIRA